MLIGVLSDTHGQTQISRVAANLLKSRNAQMLIHCGDVGGPQVLDTLLVGLPVHFVLGNTDYDQQVLSHHAQRIGIHFCGARGQVSADGKVIDFLHGDDAHAMRAILDAQESDFLLHGHTHIADVRDVGRTRIVNPGALQRAAVKTVALVDTETRDVEFLKVSLDE
jgi:putative phosphoesterase